MQAAPGRGPTKDDGSCVHRYRGHQLTLHGAFSMRGPMDRQPNPPSWNCLGAIWTRRAVSHGWVSRWPYPGMPRATSVARNRSSRAPSSAGVVGPGSSSGG